MSAAGFAIMLRIQLRTNWRVITTWVVSLAATIVATAMSITNLYDTPDKIAAYAAAVNSGDALAAINGHVYGVDSLGGVIANEFGFVASFALPLMAIVLVARTTRREEAAGRLDVLLSGRIGHGSPLIASGVITGLALLGTCVAMGVGLWAVGVTPTGAVMYPASLCALGLVFTGIAAVAAQVAEQPRDVYAIGLAALVLAYVFRGVGDVGGTFVSWLSPLGWAEEARPFGDDPRWWPIAVSVLIAAAVMGIALWMLGTRDVDSSLITHRRTRRRTVRSVHPTLHTTWGFAWTMQRGLIARWSVIAAVIGGAFGALTRQAANAVSGNATINDFLGGRGANAMLAMFVLLVVLVYAGYAVQNIGVLTAEEAMGRLESTLAGTISRRRWLGAQVVVLAGGTVIIAATGGLALGLTAYWSTGEAGRVGDLLFASLFYLPAVAVLAAIALALFGILPRLAPLAWLAYAVSAGAILLGDALQLPQWVRAMNPLYHIGSPPQDFAGWPSLAVVSIIAVVLTCAGFFGFARRDITAG